MSMLGFLPHSWSEYRLKYSKFQRFCNRFRGEDMLFLIITFIHDMNKHNEAF